MVDAAVPREFRHCMSRWSAGSHATRPSSLTVVASSSEQHSLAHAMLRRLTFSSVVLSLIHPTPTIDYWNPGLIKIRPSRRRRRSDRRQGIRARGRHVQRGVAGCYRSQQSTELVLLAALLADLYCFDVKLPIISMRHDSLTGLHGAASFIASCRPPSVRTANQLPPIANVLYWTKTPDVQRDEGCAGVRYRFRYVISVSDVTICWRQPLEAFRIHIWTSASQHRPNNFASVVEIIAEVSSNFVIACCCWMIGILTTFVCHQPIGCVWMTRKFRLPYFVIFNRKIATFKMNSSMLELR